MALIKFADPVVCLPLTESMYTVVYIEERKTM